MDILIRRPQDLEDPIDNQIRVLLKDSTKVGVAPSNGIGIHFRPSPSYWKACWPILRTSRMHGEEELGRAHLKSTKNQKKQPTSHRKSRRVAWSRALTLPSTCCRPDNDKRVEIKNTRKTCIIV